MKIWTKSAGIWLIPCWVLATTQAARPASTHPPVDADAVQAIQHAPDPSAVASAFANGIALDRSDPELYAAYVARMVEFGRPEFAYRQAQALTILQPGNGLALGVIAYADAHRGRMADAVTDINLAGQFAPENPFVARTAGELLAWYDLEADHTTFTEKARQGVKKIRALLAKQVAFTGAYATACQAYRAQSKAELPPGQAAAGHSGPAAQAPAFESPGGNRGDSFGGGGLGSGGHGGGGIR